MKKNIKWYLICFFAGLLISAIITTLSITRVSLIDYKTGVIKKRYSVLGIPIREDRMTRHFFSSFPIGTTFDPKTADWREIERDLIWYKTTKCRDPFAPSPFGVEIATWQLGNYFSTVPIKRAAKIKETFLEKLNNKSEKEALTYAYKTIGEIQKELNLEK